MTEELYRELVSRLLVLPGIDDYPIEGADEAEIEELTKYAGAPLPTAYSSFLRVMGRAAGPLFTGSDYSLAQEHRLRLRESAECVLKRKGSSIELPPSTFVFLVHHGYQFSFFHLWQGNDPPVYHFDDRAPHEFRVVGSSFSRFIVSTVEICEELLTKWAEGT